MEELTADQKDQIERILQTTIKEVGKIDPYKLGNYLLRHIEADRAINNLKQNIISKKDFYTDKDLLLDLEYFAFMLTKKP